MGDGLVEFASFPTSFSVGAEQVVHGNTRRLYQGHGPFTIRFKPLDPEQRIYFQCDGEFFVMNSPDWLTVKHYRQVRVLAKASDDMSYFVRPKN
eukprot:Trichotokara_eunicae@DN4583_c0_g1_i3.p1